MQDLRELLMKRAELQEEIERLVSDMRASARVREIVGKLFKAFPESNAIVLMAAWKGDRGERHVYDFSEIEESQEEGLNGLTTINRIIRDGRPVKWDPEVDSLFDELADSFPAPTETDFDWDGLELGERKEIIMWKEDIDV